MINVKDYYDIYKLLMKNVMNEEYKHSSYVSNGDDITNVLRFVNIYTSAEPDLIEFDNYDKRYYVLELYNEDDKISYSICPACDENESFYTNYGLCLVDEKVPDNFEVDYNEYGSHDKSYIEPVRVSMKKIDESVKVHIDRKKDGSIFGFTKVFNDGNTYYSYSYHNLDEDAVLDVMNDLNIKY